MYFYENYMYMKLVFSSFSWYNFNNKTFLEASTVVNIPFLNAFSLFSYFYQFWSVKTPFSLNDVQMV